MNRLVCGIDPGVTGAVTLLWEDSIILEVMPVNEHGIDIHELDHILRPYAQQITRCYLELSSLRPQQQGQFKIGRCFGHIEAVLAYLKIPTTEIKPQEWSKKYNHGVNERDATKRYKLIKQSRAKIVQNLFPGINFLATTRSSILHSGLVDATLIANFGMSQLKNGGQNG